MLSLLKYFFIAMGLLFTVLLIGLWFVWETNFWNVRIVAPMVLPSQPSTSTTTELLPVLLDSSAVWREQIDADARECLVELFGEERVQAIEQGASPEPAELVAGIECLS